MKRKWFGFHILGVNWKMYMGDHRSFPDYFDSGSVEGYTDYAKCICVVNSVFAVNRERAEEIAFHEIKHAVVTSTGQRFELYGGNAAREERAIVAVCGGEYSAVKTATGRRYLFPRPPFIALPRDQDDA